MQSNIEPAVRHRSLADLLPRDPAEFARFVELQKLRAFMAHVLTRLDVLRGTHLPKRLEPESWLYILSQLYICWREEEDLQSKQETPPINPTLRRTSQRVQAFARTATELSADQNLSAAFQRELSQVAEGARVVAQRLDLNRGQNRGGRPRHAGLLNGVLKAICDELRCVTGKPCYPFFLVLGQAVFPKTFPQYTKIQHVASRVSWAARSASSRGSHHVRTRKSKTNIAFGRAVILILPRPRT